MVGQLLDDQQKAALGTDLRNYASCAQRVDIISDIVSEVHKRHTIIVLDDFPLQDLI